METAADRAVHERDRLRQLIDLRGNWSWWLTRWISGLLLFQLGLTVALGKGWLSFVNYETFLQLVVVQTFGQILGMGYIIVKFLYPPGRDE